MKESNDIVENYVRSLQPDITDAEMEVLVNEFFDTQKAEISTLIIDDFTVNESVGIENNNLVLEKNFYLFLKNKIDEIEKIENKEIAFLEDENIDAINFSTIDLTTPDVEENIDNDINLKNNHLEKKQEIDEPESPKINIENKIDNKSEVLVPESKKNHFFNSLGSVLGLLAFVFFIGLVSIVGYSLYKFYKVSNSKVEETKLVEKMFKYQDTNIFSKISDSDIISNNKLEENEIELKSIAKIELELKDKKVNSNNDEKQLNSKKSIINNKFENISNKVSNTKISKASNKDNFSISENSPSEKISKSKFSNETSIKSEEIKTENKPLLDMEKKSNSKIIFGKYE